jgi:hypothetical protein
MRTSVHMLGRKSGSSEAGMLPCLQAESLYWTLRLSSPTSCTGSFQVERRLSWPPIAHRFIQISETIIRVLMGLHIV